MSRPYTKEELSFVESAYKQHELRKVHELFNAKFKMDKTFSQIRAITRNHRFRSGRTGHFKKGVPSWSKGTKGVLKANSGSFNKGGTPVNLKPFGHERTDVDGCVLIKVDQVNPYTGYRGWYRHKSVVVWEKENSSVPEGMNLRFKDGDSSNVEIENLELVSKALHFRLNKNRMNHAPDEIKPTIRAISELEVKMFARSR